MRSVWWVRIPFTVIGAVELGPLVTAKWYDWPKALSGPSRWTMTASAPTRSTNKINVRYWHLPDVASYPLESAFGGKADIKTWVSKSAHDPKRTSAVS